MKYDMSVKLYPDTVWNKTKSKNPTWTSLCFMIWYFVLFFNPVLFPNSCLSLEAETWRKTESPALSATDNYLVSDV